MAISVKCSCGKTLKVDEKYRGKKAKCPACGAAVLVEDDEEASAVQSEEPKRKPTPPKDDDDDDNRDDDDDPKSRKPIKRADAGKSNKKMYMIAGGCAGLLLLTCCCTGGGTGLLWWMGWWPFGSVPADLVYVHDGVVGFVSVRVADGYKAGIKDQIGKVDQKKDFDEKIAELETGMGLKLEDVERATIILRTADFKDRNNKPDVGFVVKTTKAMDSKKILEFIAKKEGDKEKTDKFEGATYYTFGKGGALHFASDRVVLIASSDTVLKSFLSGAKKPAKNAALVRGIQMVSAGKHQFVAAAAISKNLTDQAGDLAGDKMGNLKELNGVILGGTLKDKDLSLEAILTFPNKDVAGKAKTDVDGFVALGKMFGGGPNVPPAYGKFIDSLKVDQKSAEIIVTGKLELDIEQLGMPIMGGGRPKKVGGVKGKQFGKADFDEKQDFKDVAVVNPNERPAIPLALRITSVNHMKEIMLAMHNFHDVHKTFPNHAIRHEQTGEALLSWRVALLPYVEEGELFKQIRLNERWDSPHNRQFWNKLPRVYQLRATSGDGTYYQVFHGDQSAFPKAKGPVPPKNIAGNNLMGEIGMRHILDGSSNTFFLVEAAEPVNWMRPDDIPFQMGDRNLINRLGNHWGDNKVVVAFGDGSARPVSRNMPGHTLEALVTRAGGESVQVP